MLFSLLTFIWSFKKNYHPKGRLNFVKCIKYFPLFCKYNKISLIQIQFFQYLTKKGVKINKKRDANIFFYNSLKLGMQELTIYTILVKLNIGWSEASSMAHAY